MVRKRRRQRKTVVRCTGKGVGRATKQNYGRAKVNTHGGRVEKVTRARQTRILGETAERGWVGDKLKELARGVLKIMTHTVDGLREPGKFLVSEDFVVSENPDVIIWTQTHLTAVEARRIIVAGLTVITGHSMPRDSGEFAVESLSLRELALCVRGSQRQNPAT